MLISVPSVLQYIAKCYTAIRDLRITVSLPSCDYFLLRAFQKHGLYRHHQVLQRDGGAPRHTACPGRVQTATGATA